MFAVAGSSATGGADGTIIDLTGNNAASHAPTGIGDIFAAAGNDQAFARDFGSLQSGFADLHHSNIMIA